ncbi:three-Cys-motif partner protein TcmP [Mucilaginibacter sp.]|jgi:three-Cys-motif partner protein|uniref:three-Cys-motif partner protein TcmP n=1 Tax=Mucilaginibacter sp. TaxID=1882438 RepID=UPI002CF61E61|nr:three-Cys-motif partner protein TcmP [Mucilaginibacter sp.]HTI61168.1 three-Cys-motif partner protein TcmP [Mucilaginibacter sp.]
MPGKNLFRKPFDEGTKTKLALFEGYLLEWLPVFLSKKEIIWPVINVFDFFAGEGYDCAGTKGSPIIILDNIKKYEDYILRNNLKVNVYLNEFDKAKYSTLVQNLNEYGKVDYINVQHYNEDFQVIFKEFYPKIAARDSANLVFLDQNGIKQINRDVFSSLISASTTDILFFISSSYFARFADHESFEKHMVINQSDLINNNYYNIHRTIFSYYKSLIPLTVLYYLAPFSIKKSSNIYGLIFGSGHTLGIEKFLNQSWKLDRIRGEANFDIDNDNHTINQMDLFSGRVVGPKKIEAFESELKELILNKTLKTNYQVYEYSLMSGFLPKHANIVLRKLRSENNIKNEYISVSADIHKIKSSQTKLII